MDSFNNSALLTCMISLKLYTQSYQFSSFSRLLSMLPILAQDIHNSNVHLLAFLKVKSQRYFKNTKLFKILAT